MAWRTRPLLGTTPFWSDSASFRTSHALERDIDVDVVVVGGGITGLTAAYLLGQAGRSVAVLERTDCAGGETGHTTAHLTMVTDVRLSELARRFGRAHAQAVWDAGLAAIGQIVDIVRDHRIECDFEWVDGYLHTPSGTTDRTEADAFMEEAGLAEEMGFDVAYDPHVPFVGGPGVRIEGQARFHPRKYLAGMADAIRAKGGQIYEHSGVEEFSDEPFGARANGHLVRGREVIVATHNPAVGMADALRATLRQTKLAPYSTYVVAGRAPRGSVPDALFWDTADPYRYLRLQPDGDQDLIMLGGEDHKTGQASNTGACYARLECALLARVPGISIDYRWSGQVIETPDGLPYIGRVADHQYAATGFGGNGMTFGTLGAMMMTDAILARPNPWADLFDPGRAAVKRGLWEYIKENADYPYYVMRDLFAGPEGRTLRSVGRDQGKIIEYHGAKVAAYRDSAGTLTMRSATCTHMGCVVAWNEAERTWDCPCHGSRFTPQGSVISGPATSPLPDVKG